MFGNNRPYSKNMDRKVEKVSEVMKTYLQKNNINEKNSPWILKKSFLEGIGVFAGRKINAGEIILIDYPLIIGPRAIASSPIVCVKCYKKNELRSCKNGCGLPVCSSECETSETHKSECKIISSWKKQNQDLSEFSNIISKCLTPIRSLFLNDFEKEVLDCLDYHLGPQHGFEVDILKDKFNLKVKEEEEALMRRVCCVMDTNSFEVLVGNEDNQSSLRGLYPLSSLMNHCCYPNSMHVFDKDHRMIVKATVDIPEGSEIFHSYTRIIWSTLTRQLHLKRTKDFLCKCERCSDPTEFGSFMGAINCFKCGGFLLPTKVHKINTPWKCMDCEQEFSQSKVGTVYSVLGSILNSVGSSDADTMLAFLKNKLIKYVPECNQIAIELKCKCIWFWGYRNGYLWHELDKDILLLKVAFCNDILRILELLRVGKCKCRGLMLYELYKTHKILQERQIEKESLEMLEALIKESSDILMDDVTAPPEVKERNLEKHPPLIIIPNGFVKSV